MMFYFFYEIGASDSDITFFLIVCQWSFDSQYLTTDTFKFNASYSTIRQRDLRLARDGFVSFARTITKKKALRLVILSLIILEFQRIKGFNFFSEYFFKGMIEPSCNLFSNRFNLMKLCLISILIT